MRRTRNPWGYLGVVLPFFATMPLATAAEAPETIPAEAEQEQKRYATRGVVKSFDPERRVVHIAHEAIPGYMGAMTMSFDAATPKQLDGIAVGDTVRFSFAPQGARRLLRSIDKE